MSYILIMAKCNINERKLYDDMRIVWLKHVWWTREVILAIVAGAPWTNESVSTLLQNPTEMTAVFAPFINVQQQKQMTDLFTAHLKLGGDIVTAAKSNDTNRVNTLQTQWHQNADQIAKFMAGLGLNLNERDVRQMMYDHLMLTTNEAVLTLEGKYNEAIQTFEQIQSEALFMADYFSSGIISALCH